MESNRIYSLRPSNDRDVLTDHAAYTKAMNSDPKSPEFTEYVFIIATEIKYLSKIKETVIMVNHSKTYNDFKQKLKSFLKELGCLNTEFITDTVMLQNKYGRVHLLDYLLNELAAARIVNSNNRIVVKELKGIQESSIDETMSSIFQAMNYRKPSTNVQLLIFSYILKHKLKNAKEKQNTITDYWSMKETEKLAVKCVDSLGLENMNINKEDGEIKSIFAEIRENNLKSGNQQCESPDWVDYDEKFNSNCSLNQRVFNNLQTSTIRTSYDLYSNYHTNEREYNNIQNAYGLPQYHRNDTWTHNQEDLTSDFRNQEDHTSDFRNQEDHTSYLRYQERQRNKGGYHNQIVHHKQNGHINQRYKTNVVPQNHQSGNQLQNNFLYPTNNYRHQRNVSYSSRAFNFKLFRAGYNCGIMHYNEHLNWYPHENYSQFVKRGAIRIRNCYNNLPLHNKRRY